MTDTYTINDLRNDLEATIRAVRDGSLDIAKAKAVADLGQVMINSAKVEVDMINAVGRAHMRPTGFVAVPPPSDTLDQQDSGKPALEHSAESSSKPKPHIRTPMGSSPVGSLR